MKTDPCQSKCDMTMTRSLEDSQTPVLCLRHSASATQCCNSIPFSHQHGRTDWLDFSRNWIQSGYIWFQTMKLEWRRRMMMIQSLEVNPHLCCSGQRPDPPFLMFFEIHSALIWWRWWHDMVMALWIWWFVPRWWGCTFVLEWGRRPNHESSSSPSWRPDQPCSQLCHLLHLWVQSDSNWNAYKYIRMIPLPHLLGDLISPVLNFVSSFLGFSMTSTELPANI